MSVSDWFKAFNSNLYIPATENSAISTRYRAITRRINLDYYGSSSETQNSLYVGSYGRDTDIHVSDIDVIVKLPYKEYVRYNNRSGNGQSALLQDVKSVLQKTYSTSHLRGDGQVIQISFTDRIIFEIVPAFINTDGSYTYPDSNAGGSWKVTNPKAEINTIQSANNLYNKNLKRLCRMARAWKDKWSVPMGGLLIDTLAYNFMRQWIYSDKSYLYYDYMSQDFFLYLKNLSTTQDYWFAPGSSSRVYKGGEFNNKANQCYNIALEAIAKETYPTTAKSKWREIYGSKFPS